MNPVVKKILVIVLILAVLGYTIFTYMGGKTSSSLFMVSLAFLSYFLVSMVASLISDLKNK